MAEFVGIAAGHSDGNPNGMEVTIDESELNLVGKRQDTAFVVLAVAEIEEMMDQYIADVKSIVSVSSNRFSYRIGAKI